MLFETSLRPIFWARFLCWQCMYLISIYLWVRSVLLRPSPANPSSPCFGLCHCGASPAHKLHFSLMKQMAWRPAGPSLMCFSIPNVERVGSHQSETSSTLMLWTAGLQHHLVDSTNSLLLCHITWKFRHSQC